VATWTRAFACSAVLAAAFAVPEPASAAFWSFRTTAGAAYCRWEPPDSFRCVRPRDGFWIRLTGVSDGPTTRISKGVDPRFRGLSARADFQLRFGREWLSSDAALVSCRSRRTGLTCKQYDGLSFWLGPRRGWRIFVDAPGFAPDVRPLFRTAQGVWCGIAADVLEDSNPLLECWRPGDALFLALAHADGGRGTEYARRDKARGFRPRGFPLLRAGETFVWRCRHVDPEVAYPCSRARGVAVFTCRADAAHVTCRNRRGRGFWVGRRGFYPF
jgi:hypothetical protein